MKRRMLAGVFFIIGLFSGPDESFGQVKTPPLSEGFDTLAPPALPSGWSSTRARSPLQDDVVSAESLPRSAPNALLLTNATIAQGITTPAVSFEGRGAGEIRFSLRRSATFIARMSIEVSTDGGDSFPIALGAEFFPEADSRYVSFSVPLPASLHGAPRVRIRWVSIPAGTGTAGTLRMDDVAVTALELTDCALGGVECGAGRPAEGEPLPVRLTVRNSGILPLASWGIRFGWRESSHAEPFWNPADEVVRNEVLAAGDSSVVSTAIMPPAPGVLSLCAAVTCAGDQNPLNDSAWIPLRVGARAGRVVVSEIMNAPAAGEPEWIEIANTGSSPLALRGWMVGDEADPAGREISPPGGVLGPLGFAVIAEDTARFRSFRPDLPADVPLLAGVPSLNNAGDSLYLRDPAGNVSDSLRFTPLWHHPVLAAPAGRSLEKVVLTGSSSDGRNWGSCVDPSGGTPGRSNSIALAAPAHQTSLSVLPNPFSPDNDGHEDRTAIRYASPAGGGTMTLRIYDVRGRLVRRVANNEPCAGEGFAIWDGLDEDRRRVRIGIYVSLLEIVPPGGGSVQSAKGVVVVAGRL